MYAHKLDRVYARLDHTGMAGFVIFDSLCAEKHIVAGCNDSFNKYNNMESLYVRHDC